MSRLLFAEGDYHKEKAVLGAIRYTCVEAVYDEGEYPLNHSIVSGSNKMTLPKSGMIVFTGAPGSEFFK